MLKIRANHSNSISRMLVAASIAAALLAGVSFTEAFNQEARAESEIIFRFVKPQESRPNYSVPEDVGIANIPVTRSGGIDGKGNLDSEAFVDYTVAPGSCGPAQEAGNAEPGRDYIAVRGTLRFAPGETTKTFPVRIIDNNYAIGFATVFLTLKDSKTGLCTNSSDFAELLIIDNDSPPPNPNPIDEARFFVREQYYDFLNRAPDDPGLEHWTQEITQCSDATKRRAGESLEQCIDRKRANTAAAFFLSPEFQYTGYFIYRLYKGSFVGAPNYDGGSPGRFPPHTEFAEDSQQVAEGIVVNNQLSVERIEANRAAFVARFVQREQFKAVYDSLNNAQYVDRLFAITTIVPTAAERQALIDGLNNTTESRATVLRKVVDGTRVLAEGQVEFQTRYGKAFYDQEFNRAFVYMEYSGYLQRDPDAPGFNHWLAKLNFYGNFVDAEMVRSFLLSPEYRSRFGQQ